MEFFSEIRDSIELLEEFRKAIIESDTVLEEVISGIHRSRSGGYNTEFLDYRSYVYGDDLRFLDWKVFLKSNRYFVKRFEDNKRNSVYLYLDNSSSMFQGNKFFRSLLVLLSVANIFLRMKDDVFVVVSQERIRIKESGQNQLINIIGEIYQNRKESRGDFLGLYNRMPEIAEKNSVICLFSDLFSDPDMVRSSVSTISGTGIYQFIFHIVTKEEMNPSGRGLKLFTDPDSDETLLIQCDNIWDEYRNELRLYTGALNDLLVATGRGKYILCSDDIGLRDILLKFFEKERD